MRTARKASFGVSLFLAGLTLYACADDYKEAAIAADAAPPNEASSSTDGASSEASSEADGATPDASVPVDACTPVDGGAAPAAIAGPGKLACAAASLFCWNFNGDAAGPSWGWNDHESAANASLAVVGPLLDPIRLLQVSVDGKVPADASSALIWNDWESAIAGQQPLPIAPGHRLTLSMSFNLTKQDRSAKLVYLSFGNASLEYGLALYEDPCGGPARLGQTGEDPATFKGGVTVDPSSWYRAQIHFFRPAAGDWDVDIVLGGVKVGSKKLAVSSTADTFPATLHVGLSQVGPAGTTSEVAIDDVSILDDPQ